MSEIRLLRCVRNGRYPLIEALPVVAIVDECCFEELNQHHWFLTPKGYARRNVLFQGKKTNFSIHAEVMRIRGIRKPGDDYTVDHISGDRLDNRFSNLRWATRSQQGVNSMNRSAELPRGVMRRGGRYAAQVTRHVTGEHYWCGTFDTPEEASAAFEQKWREVYADVSMYRRNIHVVCA
jgi:hypothetical protein